MNDSSQSRKKVFDLITTGYGYLYRLREVKPKKGNSFWAITVGALHGIQDDNGRFDSSTYDLIIRGTDAIQRVKELSQYFDSSGKSEASIFVSVVMSDTYPDYFTKAGKNDKEEIVPIIKGRLLELKGAKVRFPESEPFTFCFSDEATKQQKEAVAAKVDQAKTLIGEQEEAKRLLIEEDARQAEQQLAVAQ